MNNFAPALPAGVAFCWPLMSHRRRVLTDQLWPPVTVPDTVDRVVVLQHQTLNLPGQMNATDKNRWGHGELETATVTLYVWRRNWRKSLFAGRSNASLILKTGGAAPAGGVFLSRITPAGDEIDKHQPSWHSGGVCDFAAP